MLPTDIRQTYQCYSACMGHHSCCCACAGYVQVMPVVYCGLFPTDAEQFEPLREALGRLQLNDAALQFEPEVSTQAALYAVSLCRASDWAAVASVCGGSVAVTVCRPHPLHVKLCCLSGCLAGWTYGRTVVFLCQDGLSRCRGNLLVSSKQSVQSLLRILPPLACLLKFQLFHFYAQRCYLASGLRCQGVRL